MYNRKSWVQGLKPGLNMEPEIFFTFTNNIFRKHKTSDISLIRILDWFWKILGLFIRSNILTKNIYHTFFTIQFIISNCVTRYTNMEVYPVLSIPDIEIRFLLQYFSQKSLIIVNQTITMDFKNHLHFLGTVFHFNFSLMFDLYIFNFLFALPKSSLLSRRLIYNDIYFIVL